MLYLLVASLAATMAFALARRTAWAIGLPGLVLLALVWWLLFGS